MRRLSLSFLSCLVATGALAQVGPSTLRMSCGQANGLVAVRGAIVLSTGPHTYDRFVRSRNFCEINETIEPAFVPTADVPQCWIGYRCRDADPFWFDD